MTNNATSTITNLTMVNATSTNATTTALYSSGQSILAATSGNVGIGTTNPGKKLDIAGDVQADSQFQFTGAIGGYAQIQALNSKDLQLQTSGSGSIVFNPNTVEKMRISNAGLVGIGTTTPNWMLQIASSTASNTMKGQLALTDSGAGANLKHWLFASQGGNLYIGTSTDVYATSTPAALTILNGGNIGIGTTTPSQLLSIAGSIYMTGAINPNGGNIGIGQSSPQSVLDIAAAANTLLTMENTTANATTNRADMMFQLNDSNNAIQNFARIGAISTVTTAASYGGSLAFYTAGSGTGAGAAGQERMRIDNVGRIGIGTTTPNWIFQISSTTPSLALSDSSAGANLKHWLLSSMGGNLYIGTSTDVYATSTPAALTILNGGNVGIGIASPGARLDITFTNSTANTNVQGILASPTISGAMTDGVSHNWYGLKSSPSLTSNINGAGSGELLTVRGIYSLPTSSATFNNGSDSLDIIGSEATPNWTGSGLGASDSLALYGFKSVPSVNLGTTAVTNKYGAFLDVSGTARNNYGILVNNVSAATNNYGIYVDSIAVASTNYALYSNAAAKSYFAGNLGIGTTTPFATLQVATTTGKNLVLSDSGASANLKHWLFSSMGGNLYIGTSTDVYATSTPAALTILNNGNLGIGTSSPSAQLAIHQTNAVTSDNMVVNVTNTANAGTVSSGSRNIRNQYSSLAPTATVTNATVNSIGLDHVISLSNLTVGDSSTLLTRQRVFGTQTNITGTPVINNTNAAGDDGQLLTYGTYVNNSITPTLTAVTSVAAETYGGYFSSTMTSAGNANLSSTVYGIYAAGSGNLTTTGGTSHYGGYFLANGTADTNIALSIGGATQATDNYGIYISNVSAGATNYALYSPATAQSYFAGNLGIGTTTPMTLLDIASSTASNTMKGQLALTDSGAAANKKHWLFASQGGNLYIGTSTDVYATSTPAALTILNNGSVGIGTAAPLYPLVVANGGGDGLEFVPDGTANTNWLQSYNRSSAAYVNTIYNALSHQFVISGTEKMRIDSTGNVGIGTTSPWALLSVNAPAGQASFAVGSSTATSFLVDKNGNVGIGTTIPGSSYAGFAAAAGGTVLDVVSKANANSTVLRLLNVPTAPASQYQTALEFGVTDGSSANTTYNAARIYAVAAASPTYPTQRLTFATPTGAGTWTDTMSLIGGNVGIGTTTPNWLLQVAGTRPSLALSDTNAAANKKHWLLSSMGGNLYIGTSTDVYATSTPAALTILNGGNVGIGITAPASLGDGGTPTILQVHNGTNVANAYGLLNLSSTRTTNGELVGQISFGTTGSAGEKRTAVIQAILDSSGTGGGAMTFGTNNAGTIAERMRILGNGNVGIATTSPWAQFAVSNLTSGPSFIVVDNSSAPDDTPFIINTTGNVGIGKTLPAQKLHVVGNLVMDSGSTGAQTYMTFTDGTTNQWYLASRDTIDTPNNRLALYNASAATEVMTFLQGGTVGIGTTDNTVYKLAVNSGTAASAHDDIGVGGLNGWSSGEEHNISAFYSDTTAANKLGTISFHYDTTNSGAIRFQNIYNSGNNSAVAMTIIGAGNVGIGTTGPTQRLQLGSLTNASSATPETITLGGTYSSTAGANVKIRVYDDGTSVGGMSVSAGQTEVNTWAGAIIAFYRGTTKSMMIDGSGNLGIGMTPTVQLELSTSGAQKSSGTTWSNPSDIRLKTNISAFTDGLSMLKQINPVHYTLNGLAGTPAGESDIGVIAQEILPVAPYTVSTYDTKLNPNDATTTSLYRFNASALTFALINGVKNIAQVINLTSAPTTTPSLVIDSTGNIGIGTSTPDYKLRVEGDIAAQSFINISTRDAKQDITQIDVRGEDRLLKALMNATTTHYQYANDLTHQQHLGLIAEDAPSEIKSANGKGIDLYKMSTALLAGLKSQQRKIEELDAAIAESHGAQNLQTNAWSVDQQSGKVNVGFMGDVNMQGHVIMDVGKIIGSLGKWSIDENGTLMAVKIITDEMITKKLAVSDQATFGSREHPIGITIYDQAGGDPYCIKIKNGAMVSEAGECGVNSQFSIPNVQSSSNDSIINVAATSTSTPAVVADTATSTPADAQPATTTPAVSTDDAAASATTPAVSSGAATSSASAAL